MTLRINNRDARRLWLETTGLAAAPTGPLDLLGIIKKLGFVQLDTIRNVTRAHHHILWSRNQNYCEPMLNKLLADERGIFEHFTHDASVLPMETYCMWQRQFKRLGGRVPRSNLSAAEISAIKTRIRTEGPLSTHAFNTKISGKKEMWARPPHKIALDAMWYSGELATSHRENFKKFYDLRENVIPDQMRNQEHSDTAQIDWLCRAALQKLAFGTAGDIQRFWAAVQRKEVQAWAETAGLVPVEIEAADKSWSEAYAFPDIEQRLAECPAPTSRLRILNPFDPAIRDRNRLKHLFGLEYRNEMFVPAAKRQWGYYVYPLLEVDRFVGRIELKCDRKKGAITVTKFWQEPKTKWPASRFDKLDAELNRLTRLSETNAVHWACPR